MADGTWKPTRPMAARRTPDTPPRRRSPVVWSPKLDAGEGTADDLPHAEAAETVLCRRRGGGCGNDAPSSAPAGDATSRHGRCASPCSRLRSRARRRSVRSSDRCPLSASRIFGPPSRLASPSRWRRSPQAAKAELAELSALKASLDAAARNANGQFAKLADRLDRIERAQIEPALKLARIADAVDRLDKKNVTASAATAAPETTGSICVGSAGGDGRREIARQSHTGLDRAGRARWPCSGREPVRRRFRGRGRQRPSRPRPHRRGQAPGRPMGRRHRARRHRRTLDAPDRSAGAAGAGVDPAPCSETILSNSDSRLIRKNGCRFSAKIVRHSSVAGTYTQELAS